MLRARAANLVFLLCFSLLAGAGPLAAQDALAAGDAAWARRAEGSRGGHAAAGPIDEAIAGYERAVKAAPGDLEPYWKLLRAIHFKGDFVARTQAERQDVFGRGRAVSEAGLDLLGKKVGGRAKLDAMTPQQTAKALAGVPGAIQLYLWAGVDWGLWGDAFGKIPAARQGVGERIRKYGEVALAMDERFDRAAAHRLLGRLHTLAPKIPFITGWIDRDAAVSHLRRAVALAPEDPLNQLYLADALLQHQPGKRAEAVAILRRLVQQPPAADRQVEDSKAVEDARALLARQSG